MEKKDGDGSSGIEMEYITTSQALQIAGRAGRYNTQFQDGYVTTLKKYDLPTLKHILSQPLEKIQKAGLHPTADQIELFAYHLPDQPLSSLINIFMTICKIDSGQYFLCNFEDVKALAELIDHIPIKLKAKYTFATSPINRKEAFLVTCFVKFVRFYSNNEPVTIEALKKIVDFPFSMPKNIADVRHLEVMYDALDLYLWLSYRFSDIFCNPEEVKAMRINLEATIYQGVKELSKSNIDTRQAFTRNQHHRNAKKSENNTPESNSQIRKMFNTGNSQNQRVINSMPLNISK